MTFIRRGPMKHKEKCLIVDENSEFFDIEGMASKTFKSDLTKVRQYAMFCIKSMPEKYKEKNLLEQQLSEIIKNAVKHGNKADPNKKVKVWFKANKRKKYVHFIIEDEGEGFKDLEKWNDFAVRRNKAIESQDFDEMLKYINYKTDSSTEMDGGNALFAAIEYWNGGMIYNEKKNKVSVVRYF
jgi:hypothetical protein